MRKLCKDGVPKHIDETFCWLQKHKVTQSYSNFQPTLFLDPCMSFAPKNKHLDELSSTPAFPSLQLGWYLMMMMMMKK
jgi:hypothetical protein